MNERNNRCESRALTPTAVRGEGCQTAGLVHVPHFIGGILAARKRASLPLRLASINKSNSYGAGTVRGMFWEISGGRKLTGEVAACSAHHQ